MMTSYTSKHGRVSRQPFDLYMSFADMRNFVSMLPEDKKQGVKADFDTIEATVQGFTIGVKVIARAPYSRIDFADDNAPFHFEISVHFDADASDPSSTDMWMEVRAELNMMMKMMIGGRIQQALDKVMDSVVDASAGRMPEGFDMSSFGL